MPPARTLRPKTAAELHRAWLELVETDGPFLAIPPLKRVWPQGIPALGPDRLDTLRQAKPAFDHAWEALDIEPEDQTRQAKYADARDVWVQAVLRDVVGWNELLAWGPESAPGVTGYSPDRRLAVVPDGALRGPDGIGALVSVVAKTDSLHGTGTDGWAATAIDRMEAMLRASGVTIGIVTDGRWWALVCARPDAMVASGIVDAQTWVEEPLTRNAFLTVTARQYIIGGDPNERLPKLFEESVAAAEEITEALGAQVRRAVELLIQAFDEVSTDHRRRGLPDPLPADPHETYSAAVTVMMRVVFLLFAEERGLLPQSELFLQGYGISGDLDALEHRNIGDGEESLDSTYLTWHRLLATSQALYRGASFENMRMPAYGGSLFDPDRHPFLTVSSENSTLALPVSDWVMLHVLRSVQVAQLKGGDARRISFRDIDVEQIGYIYEGLLGYTCTRVNEIHLGLVGTAGSEPEVSLTLLERLAEQHGTPAALAKAIIAWLKDHQPGAVAPSANALAKLLAATPSEDADRHLRAITEDQKLRDRLRRWATVTRPDLRGRPTVVLADGLLVTETPSRKNAGAHYTPRDLAERVARHALEPLCYFPGPHQTPNREEWQIRQGYEILNLKVADIAAGSGAFLVAAARYLADKLVEAWDKHGSVQAVHRDLKQHAIREVVARCLYGADINAMAVEMCKLSLWLVSLDRDLPFSFVDDKILHGNTLLGLTNLRQLEQLHIDAPKFRQAPLTGIVDIKNIINSAVAIRRELASEVKENDPQRSATAKTRLLAQLHTSTALLSKAADGVIAAGLRLGGAPTRTLEESYDSLAEAVRAAIPRGTAEADPTMLDEIIELGLTPTVTTDYERWKPLHWVLEVPDVIVDHGGFDAIIGNPPFLGAKMLSGTVGTNVREWLVNQLANGAKGRADLVAYFLLRAVSLLNENGVLGLIATNSVAQGASREVGLDQVVKNGFTLTRSVQSAPWPSASANLEYAAMWGTKSVLASEAHKSADGVVVPQISTMLEAAGSVEGAPIRLLENEGIGFVGCTVLGMEFVLEVGQAQAWMAEDRRNREVLFPYLNGEDLNSRSDCSASRWVIDFNDRSEEEARSFTAPFSRLSTFGKLDSRQGNESSRRDRWWQYWRNAPTMRAAIANLREVLVIALVSKTVMPMRVPTRQVFNNKLGVFATDSFADQAVLSSSVHQLWAIKYSVTLRTDVNYTPSEVFDTFPRPSSTPLLGEVGAELDAIRREMMLRRNLGLTKLYNFVNDPDHKDPDILQIRQLHVALDEAVMAAYGWSDVPLEHGFHSYRQMTRWTVSPAARVEILDRLLAENLRRAAAQGKKEKPKKATARTARGSGRRPAANENQETLL
ncbi:Eco57I restriction-modification methylase domain-containing protein [Actinoplanes aureus]|uniref:site-specific DNA-methyltransferase (adenine-specific) n=1 Tax=Actinoplanes aureus TaxID=2792083 RepID=A0A931FXE5_9ACTN|nr:DNA methyltransferase [Actinoplanes aureus]MBG0560776.1 SAM-dependent DNA methyltransferase [Actinoplanes aureus]